MDIVKFEGAWKDRDKTAVRQAVGQAEAILHLDTPRSLIGKPWLCQYEVTGTQPAYLARRVNLDYDFTGETCVELVKDLLMIASEKRRQARFAPYWRLPGFLVRRAERRGSSDTAMGSG